MKSLLLIICVCCCRFAAAQCTFQAALAGHGQCIGDTLVISSDFDNVDQVMWFSGTTLVKTVKASNTGTTVAGGNGAGNASNQFIGPSSVFVDGSGNIYVTDRGNNRVQKWAPGATIGTTVAGGNGIGPAPAQLYYPCASFVDAAGNVFVSDQNNQRIQKWLPGASSGLTVAGGNGYGIGPNQFLQPWGIFVDGAGNLYVVDQGANRVQKFPSGSNSTTPGETVAGAASGVTQPSAQLVNPVGVYVDGPGNIYITDDGNSRVQKWAPGATAGSTVAGGNGPGSNANQLDGIGGVYVDGKGDVYIADENNNRIQKWPPGATEGITVAGGFGYGSGSSPGELNKPLGVWLTGDAIYIADYANNRIQKWSELSVSDSILVAAGAGTFSATVTNSDGCVAKTNSVAVSASREATVQVGLDSSNLCEGSKIAFSALLTNAGPNPDYFWQVNGAVVASGTPGFSNADLKSGDNIVCQVNPDNSCSVSVSSNPIVLSLYPAPSISFGPDKQIFRGGSTTLVATVVGNKNRYLWSPSASLNNDTIADPVATPTVSTTYSLKVTSSQGCEATGHTTVNIFNGLLVPNAFSPNGDGLNDTWNINTLALDFPACKVEVFNRFGQPVFYSEGYNKPWDGYFHGRLQPAGAYFYVINLNNGMPVLSGSLMLVR